MTTHETIRQLDTFTRAYIECALWSLTDNADDSGGEPLEANYAIADIAPDTLARMIEDCRAFQDDNRADLNACGLTIQRQGHDFWLTRNRHGSGFWDGYRKDYVLNNVLWKLTEASHTYGSFDLYIGSDEMIYGS